MNSTHLRYRFAPLLFLGVTLLAQSGGLAASSVARSMTDSIPCFLLLWASVAFIVTSIFKLPLPWRITNIIMGPLFFALLFVHLSPLLMGVPLLVLAAIYLPTFWTRVPYYPTSRGILAAISAELSTRGNTAFSFLDCGCGNGLVLIPLSKQFPHAQFVGVEIGFLPFIVAKLRSLFCKNVTILFKSLWSINLEEFDFVYAFLAPGPMPTLYEKFQREKHAGATLLVNSFPCPATPVKTTPVLDDRECVLYLYK